MRKMWAKMSIDELLEEEIELLEQRANDKPWAIYNLTNLYSVLLNKIRKDRDYVYLKEQVGKKLIENLVDYGTYMKTIEQRDNKSAEESLKKALRYDKNIPIAHYRLGFLSYKKSDYSKASNHFQQAIELNKLNSDPKFKLNELQQFYAHLYLVNSALYVAQYANESLTELEKEGFEQLPNYEISPLFDVISSNEEYLSENAFSVVTKKGRRFCSKFEAEDLLETKSKLICYFGDREFTVIFNGKNTTLSQNRAELLRYILLYGTENRPATKEDMIDIFKSPQISDNTFYQAIRRLKSQLDSISFPTETIQGKRINAQPGYFYTGELDYYIIHRSDFDFILD